MPATPTKDPLANAPADKRHAAPRSAAAGSSPATADTDDLRAFLRNRAVTSIGRFASMSQQEFEDLIKDCGARYVSRRTRPDALALVVIGEAEWPLDRSGTLWEYLREARVCKRREGYQFRRVFSNVVGIASRPAIFELQIAAFGPTKLLQPLQQRLDACL